MTICELPEVPSLTVPKSTLLGDAAMLPVEVVELPVALVAFPPQPENATQQDSIAQMPSIHWVNFLFC